MDKLKYHIQKLGSKRMERLFMSFMSGFMTYQYLRFTNRIIDHLEVNPFMFIAMLTCYLMGLFFIRNLRKYFLTDKYEMLMLFIGFTASYFLFYYYKL